MSYNPVGIEERLSWVVLCFTWHQLGPLAWLPLACHMTQLEGTRGLRSRGGRLSAPPSGLSSCGVLLSSDLAWAFSLWDSRLSQSGSGSCQDSLELDLELTQCHFHLSLLVKASHMARPGAMERGNGLRLLVGGVAHAQKEERARWRLSWGLSITPRSNEIIDIKCIV